MLKGFGDREDRGEERQTAQPCGRQGHDVRVRGGGEREEADGDHKRDARECEVPTGA